MKIINLSIVFVLVFLIDLVAVYANNEALRYATKPLLMPVLTLFFISETRAVHSSLKKLIIAALIFSWLGDVLLMFENFQESFFIYGLVSFLITQVFYILFFEKIIIREKLKQRYWIFLPVIAFYIALILVLSPTLGDLNWPVRIYGIVICYMLIKALQAGWIRNRLTAFYFISGAVLFVISDSVLAWNRFYQPFEYSGILIMTTYGMAQLLLVSGAVRYVNTSSVQ